MRVVLLSALGAFVVAQKDQLAGSSAKALQFSDVTGEPIEGADGEDSPHQQLYNVLELGELDADTLNNIQQGQPQSFGLANPMGAYAKASGNDPDSAEFWAPYMRGTPLMNSNETAGEMVENYWWYLARDIRLADYGDNTLITQAAANINGLTDFRGPGGTEGESVTPANIFRGPTRGDLVGPYISQFLYLPMSQSSGDTDIYKREWKWLVPEDEGGNTVRNTFMAKRDDAINVLSGNCPRDELWCLEPDIKESGRYIISQRDLAWYVRYVYTYTSFYNSFIQITQPPIAGAGGQPNKFDKDNNPYENGSTDGTDGQKQLPFIMYGSMDVHGALGDVARRAVKGAWYHKWRGSFRFRPEEYGLKLDNVRLFETNPYELHEDIVENTELLDLVAEENEAVSGERTWLFAQTYPEGAPTHPAFPSAHATIAGACSTILKAMFDEDETLYAPGMDETPGYNVAMIPNLDGSDLIPYEGPEALTLGGEIDKLASNIAYGRQPAGVHYRSDSEDGLEFGEAVAIEYLYELVLDHPEPEARFSFRKRNGMVVDITKADTIEDGITVDGEPYQPLSERDAVQAEDPAEVNSGMDPALSGIYAKSMPFDRATGLPNTGDHEALRAEMEKPELDHDSLINLAQAPGALGMVNPSAAWSPQSHVANSAEYWASYMRPTPTIDSAETAGEMVENYWWALARDVHFDQYASDETIQMAVDNINTLSDFRGPTENGEVTVNTLFRGPTPGDQVGPYISQFLYLPKQQYCYSAKLYEYDQKYAVPVEGPQSDRMATREECMTSIEGSWSINGAAVEPVMQAEPRYMQTQRDLAWWVRYVYTNSAFYDAAVQIFERPVWTAGGDSNKLDQEASPYRNGNTLSDDGMNFQVPFVTFGTMDAHGALGAVARRAVKGTWYHKWRGSLRLRPEEYGLKLDNIRVSDGLNPDSLHEDIVSNQVLLDAVSAHNEQVAGDANWLHAQAYPEGAPMHPAFPSAHATIAGACSTILKAFFNETAIMYDPAYPPRDMSLQEPDNAAVMPTANGLELEGYDGAEVLTLGGEIDKLASNIAYGRQPAGVHYRSDSEDGLQLGEEVAMQFLLELVRDHPEPNAKFQFTRRNGDHVSITEEGIDVTPGTTPPGSSSDDSLSTGAWVGIGIGIGLVAIIAIVGVSKSQKKRDGEYGENSIRKPLVDNNSGAVN